jgi:hypothetical protein
MPFVLFIELKHIVVRAVNVGIDHQFMQDLDCLIGTVIAGQRTVDRLNLMRRLDGVGP